MAHPERDWNVKLSPLIDQTGPTQEDDERSSSNPPPPLHDLVPAKLGFGRNMSKQRLVDKNSLV